MRIPFYLLFIVGILALIFSIEPPFTKSNPLQVIEESLKELTIQQKDQKPITLIFDCEKVSACPHLKSDPALSLSSEWTAAIKHTLQSLPQVPVYQAFPSKISFEEHYGFDKSALQLELLNQQGQVTQLQFGSHNSFYQSYYLTSKEREQDFFLLVKDQVYRLFSTPEQQIIDRRLFGDIPMNTRVAQLIISGPSMSPLVLERTDFGWQVNKKRADVDYVRGYLSDLFTLKVAQIISELAAEEQKLCQTESIRTYSIQYRADERGSLQREALSLFPPRENQKFWCVRRGSMPYFYLTSDASFLQKKPREEHFSVLQ